MADDTEDTGVPDTAVPAPVDPTPATSKPQPVKAPDFTSLNAMGDEFKADQQGAETQLAADKAQESKFASAFDKNDAGMADVHKQRIAALQEQKKALGEYGGMSPKDNMSYVMNQAPLFLALMTLAGGSSRGHAMTALSSLNGMVQGIAKGDQAAYKEAWDKYDQKFQVMQQQWKIEDETFKELESAYGDSEQGIKRRYEIARAAAGDDQKTAQHALDKRFDIEKIKATLTQQYMKAKEAEAASNYRADATVKSAALRATKASGKVTADQNELYSSMEANIDEAIKTIELHKGTTGLAGTVRSAGETVGGALGVTKDASAHLVDQKLTQITAQAVKLAGMRPGIKSMEEFKHVVGGQNIGSSDPNVIARLKALKKEIQRDRHAGTSHDDIGVMEGPVEPAGNEHMVPSSTGGKVRVKSLGNGKWQIQQ